MISIRKSFFYYLVKYYNVCKHCGYSGSDWSDSDECPNCGEVNWIEVKIWNQVKLIKKSKK